jgi:SAM-dependent methyltransferase
MPTQYDNIGSRYKAFKDLPAVDLEEPSVLKRLGNIDRLNCLDLACGLGNWCGFLVRHGAAKVVGVDISERMIKAARESLPEEMVSKVSFDVKDCSKPVSIDGGPFDVVFAGWFLNYAPDYDTMVRMWTNIHRNLKPGGKFIGITPNTHCPMFEPVDDGYGMICVPIETVGEGWKCRLTAHLEQGVVEFENYHFMHDLYEKAASEAGMINLKWHPVVPPNDSRYEEGFWDAYFLRPHMNIVTANKPESP